MPPSGSINPARVKALRALFRYDAGVVVSRLTSPAKYWTSVIATIKATAA
jgi:hypothetical protein